LSKFFRINHRDKQIGEKRQGNEADNNVFHKSLEFFAPVGVDLARHKKQSEHGDVNKVSHRFRFKVVNWLGMASIPNRQIQPLVATNQFHSLGQTSRKLLAALIKI
jgi:hypothetical protein